ncbi:MAG: molybdopterin cofactor-binding domain-containing protein, partial [Actinomycetota bacterium]
MTLGDSPAKPDAFGKVTGDAQYAGDLEPDDVLHAKVVFTDRVHARITSLDVDTARAMPGVVAVLTATDVPVNEYGLTKYDQPVLIGPDSTGRSVVPHDVSRWEADHLAVVVAESADEATAAALTIGTEWDDLPIVADLDDALARDAPVLHPEDGTDSNVYAHLVIRKGDVEQAFASAAHVVEGAYEVPYQEHAYLQTEAALAYIDDAGRVTVETAGQWTHEDQEQIAHALDLPVDRVRVIYRAIGGAFGGKEDMSLQIVLGLAASRLQALGIDRPVRCEWSREESIVGHHKRHRATIHAKLGATSDGRITAVDADVLLDAGAYNYTS